VLNRRVVDNAAGGSLIAFPFRFSRRYMDATTPDVVGVLGRLVASLRYASHAPDTPIFRLRVLLWTWVHPSLSLRPVSDPSQQPRRGLGAMGFLPEKEGITLTRCSLGLLSSRGRFVVSPRRGQRMATPLTSAKHPFPSLRSSPSTRHPQGSKLPTR
jgi:hypothetical protein